VSDIDGSRLTPVVTRIQTPIGITIDRENSELYYTEVIFSTQSGHIWKSDMDGSNTRKIVTTQMSLGLFYTEEEVSA
jgi:hypothetical protein